MCHQPPVAKQFNATVTRIAAVVITAAAALVIGSPAGMAQTVRGEASVIAQFQSAVTDYTELHRRLEQGVEPIVVTTDVQAIERGIDAMAAAMRTARPGAKQGDLFTPALAGIFRAVIDEALRAHGLTVEEVRAAAMDDAAGTRVSLRVYGAFQWHAASAMPACMFEALPQLPPELEYRLVGPDMVLVDLHANLIVDVLRNALAATTTR